jgi:hypothetical protein
MIGKYKVMTDFFSSSSSLSTLLLLLDIKMRLIPREIDKLLLHQGNETDWLSIHDCLIAYWYFSI